MPNATELLLFFPAFMIGTGLGSLFTLGILGKGGSLERNVFAIGLCAAGSAAGCGIAMLTDNWWPPLIGPFVMSIVTAIAVGLILPKERGSR